MPKPITVYLDSSDFSELSVPSARHEHAEVARRLTEFRDRGQIVLRFSYVHVMEAAPTVPEHVTSAARRFECMRRMCGTYCFVDPITLLKLGNPAAEAARDDGDWFPALVVDKSNLPDFEKTLLEQVRQLPSREERRRAEALWLDSHGRVRPETRALFRELVPQLVATIADQYPLSTDSMVEVTDAIAEGDSSRAAAAIHRSIGNLSVFGRWYAMHWDSISPLSAALRVYGERMRAQFASMVDKVRTLVSAMRSAGRTDDQIQAYLAATSLASEKVELMARKLAAGFGADLAEPSWHLNPHAMTMAAVWIKALRRTAFMLDRARRPKASDGLDLLHLLYAPSVDIFRCDQFMASVVGDAKLPLRTTFVPTFSSLIPAIENRL